MIYSSKTCKKAFILAAADCVALAYNGYNHCAACAADAAPARRQRENENVALLFLSLGSLANALLFFKSPHLSIDMKNFLRKKIFASLHISKTFLLRTLKGISDAHFDFERRRAHRFLEQCPVHYLFFFSSLLSSP